MLLVREELSSSFMINEIQEEETSSGLLFSLSRQRITLLVQSQPLSHYWVHFSLCQLPYLAC